MQTHRLKHGISIPTGGTGIGGVDQQSRTSHLMECFGLEASKFETSRTPYTAWCAKNENRSWLGKLVFPTIPLPELGAENYRVQDGNKVTWFDCNGYSGFSWAWNDDGRKDASVYSAVPPSGYAGLAGSWNYNHLIIAERGYGKGLKSLFHAVQANTAYMFSLYSDPSRLIVCEKPSEAEAAELLGRDHALLLKTQATHNEMRT